MFQRSFNPAKKEIPLKTAIYPGSFDPITNGHIDIIERTQELFDRIIVAVADNSSKKSLFTVKERMDLISAVLKDRPNVEVDTFSGLLVDYAEKMEATAVIRGLRAVTDFDYEYAMFQMNQDLYAKVDTIFLLSSKEYSFLSSTIIKEVARFGKSVENYAPSIVDKALLKKFGHL